MALILLKRTGLKPNHDLVLLAVADEEAGGDYELEWPLERHRHKVLTEFAINEGEEFH